jgi:AcrR family transcriptional regulator
MSTKPRIAPRDVGLDAVRSHNGLARAQVGEIQRTRILAAMTEACAERGAANVTVAHVVERSGVSRRTFYELFDDCQDCFLVAVDDGLGRLAERVLPVYERESRWRERIDATLTALLSYLEAEPAMGRLLAVETLGGGHLALERRNRVLARAVLAVGAGRRESKAGRGLPPLTAEGVVGGVVSVLHGRMLNHEPGSLLELKGHLMAMIVLPYLGRAAAQRELERPVPPLQERSDSAPANPLHDLDMRLTYRTVRVLTAVAARPNSSNREIALAAGIADQGQTSKLLMRLDRLGLIENGAGHARGGPNAWTLSAKGAEIERMLGEQPDKSCYR